MEVNCSVYIVIIVPFELSTLSNISSPHCPISSPHCPVSFLHHLHVTLCVQLCGQLKLVFALRRKKIKLFLGIFNSEICVLIGEFNDTFALDVPCARLKLSQFQWSK